MQSKANLKAHPLHPALVPFPFAFLTGALLFDTAGLLLDRPPLWLTGMHLTVAGIAAGLIAAIPGVIDYLYTVPPASSGQKRARTHAMGNVAALALFTASWFARDASGAPGLITLACELGGAALLAYSGWLGGTLVTRNLISVDHRYADAGKWHDESLAGPAGRPLLVGRADELKPDQMKLLRINGHRLVLARTAGEFRVFDDRCTHRGGSLAGGVVIAGTVQCLWHGSQFDTASGAATCGPATTGVRSYEVEVTPDGRIMLVSPPG